MVSTEHGEGGPRYELRLLPQHARLLIDSAITAEVAQARGYRSIETRADLRRLGFGSASPPALLIPIHGVTGERVLYQLRPDEPRMVNGRVVKYETPRGSRMVLDVPPTIREKLGNPLVPLVITEGVRKADAAASKDLCCVALLGVWTWRGTNEHGGKVALPEFELIALNNREVYIAFDSDVMLKRPVHLALARLADFLGTRGANIRFIYFEPGSGGGKVGLDDFLVQGKSVGDLFALATTNLRQCVGDNDGGAMPYAETPRGLVHLKSTQHGVVETPLTNFPARIVAEIVEDDGTDDNPRRLLEIEAHVSSRTFSVTIPAVRFAGMGWVGEHLGTDAVLYPGMLNKDHARVAIQMLSDDVAKRHRYTHMGWRVIDGVPVYLHGGGAIGADGAVAGLDVSLPGDLDRFVLPTPPAGEQLVAAVRASLGLLDLAANHIAAPIYAAIWRSVLRPADFSLHVTGPTGVFKTALAALAQAHWGAGVDERHLPAAWSGTANALEALAFIAKEALLAVDDFAPGGTSYDVARAHRDADRLLRAQGNSAGRKRMRADTSLRPPKPPRGLILSTGEDVPLGQSLRARILILELGPDDVDTAALTRCQANAAAGCYAAALAGFVQWVAGRYDEVWATWATDLLRLRGLATKSDAHRRTPDIVANLALGIGWFFLFTHEIGALTLEEIEERWRAVWAVLGQAASRQTEQQAAAEPAARFLDLLRGALVSGDAHVAGADGREPANPAAWGWRERQIGTGDSVRNEWQPHGDRVGWTDAEALYLHAAAAYAAVQRFGRAGPETLAVSLQTLKKRLYEKGLLVATDTRAGKRRFDVRRKLGGERRAVLHFSATLLREEEVAQVAHDDADPQTSAESGDASWATLWATRISRVAQTVAHCEDASGAAPQADGPLGPPHAADGPKGENKIPATVAAAELDARLFALAERAGFPRLALSPAVTVLPGRDAWRLFATHGTSPSLRASALGALCGRQPGEEG